MSKLLPLSSGSNSSHLIKPFNPKELIALEKWQDYIYFGAMFFTICTVAKRIINGDVTGTLFHSWMFTTEVMGKVYTDDACAKFTLGQVAKSMESHVTVLQQEVQTFQQQLEQNQTQLASFQLENQTYFQNNKTHQSAIQDLRQLMEQYQKELQDHQAAVKKLKEEAQKETQRKEKAQQDLEDILKRVEEASKKLQK